MITPGALAGRDRQAWPLTGIMPPMAPLPTAAAAARGFASAACAGWGLGALADAAVLVTSELVTNAVRASTLPGGQLLRAGGRLAVVGLRLSTDGACLLAEVLDQAPGSPQVARPGPDAENGRGLGLVMALSAQWGWNRRPGGKTVWALLREPA